MKLGNKIKIDGNVQLVIDGSKIERVQVFTEYFETVIKALEGRT